MKKVFEYLVVILAAFGVLFIILLFLPDDEEENVSETVTEETVEMAEEDTEPEENASPGSKEEASEEESPAEEKPDDGKNTVQVNIPESEVSGKPLKFRTMNLDKKRVTEDIFKDYDITVVHVWGTYCGPCIAEMGDYASFYKELPDNVNLMGLVLDTYDGIDSNVDAAHEILSDAGAEFDNIRVSDSLYDLASGIDYIPSSFLVDREGHIIGKIMEGVRFEETKKGLMKYLE